MRCVMSRDCCDSSFLERRDLRSAEEAARTKRGDDLISCFFC